MTRVSVAVATYNGERHLQQQLESFLAQTVLPDEVVIYDDSSTDRTVEVARQFSARAPFEVKIFVGDRVGFGQNFGRALAETSGDIVFMSDQDDEWDPIKVERVLMVDAALVVHDLMLCQADLTPIGQSMSQRLKAFGLPIEQHIKGCCTAVRRELLEVALPIPAGLGHDTFLHELAAARGERVFLDEPLIRYRLHESNTSGWALNSAAPASRRLMLRLKLRALVKRLRGAPRPDVARLVADRLAASTVSTRQTIGRPQDAPFD